MAISTHLIIVAAIGLGPVLLFLAGLLYFDSFKLVGFPLILGVLGLGALAAVACYFVSGFVMDTAHINFSVYSHFVAPLIEEGMKAAILIWLFARNRIGFMVDAAILGFAAGAGFSVFENIYYALIFPDANIGVWIARGLGTAIMHGGVTALYAIATQALRERHAEMGVVAYLPGFLIAASLHSMFNQLTPWPVFQAVGTVLALPLILLLLIDKSEHAVHDWLIQDYETHEHLLADIESGAFSHSAAANFIRTLAAKIGEQTVVDIFVYIKLHTELVLRADAMLLARERGEPASAEPADREEFLRLSQLERKIGRTIMMTVWPYLKFSPKELWELHRLETRTAGRARG
jgi:protease PrsW